MTEQRGLNQFNGGRIGEGCSFVPFDTHGIAGFQMNLPVRIFSARTAQQSSAWQEQGLVFNGNEKPIWQASRRPQAPPTVCADSYSTPPFLGRGARLVEQKQRAIFGMPEDGVPAWDGAPGCVCGGPEPILGATNAGPPGLRARHRRQRHPRWSRQNRLPTTPHMFLRRRRRGTGKMGPL